MKDIPENIRRCMTQADRKKYGLPTTSEVDARNELLSELDLHDQFISFLRRHELGYIHANPTKPSTIKKGMPDFGVYDGSRILWIEFKVGRNDLSAAQKEQIERMVARQNVVFVCRDYAMACGLVRKFFHLPDDL